MIAVPAEAGGRSRHRSFLTNPTVSADRRYRRVFF
jgi:hypothetical protein